MSVLISCPSYAGNQIGTKHQGEVDYYAWIGSISSGPIEWKEMTGDEYENADADTVTDLFYRVVVTNSEIYSTVYIEEITRGSEGCCVKLASIRKMDLDDFKNKFSLLGEISGFKLIRWNSPRSFNFKIGGREFVAKGLGNKMLDVDEILHSSTPRN